MNRYEVKKAKQMELLEGGVEMKNRSAKRVNIVTLKMLKESSLLYKNRQIKSPGDANKLFRQFLAEADREYFVVICLDTKNQPTASTFVIWEA